MLANNNMEYWVARRVLYNFLAMIYNIGIDNQVYSPWMTWVNDETLELRIQQCFQKMNIPWFCYSLLTSVGDSSTTITFGSYSSSGTDISILESPDL